MIEGREWGLPKLVDLFTSFGEKSFGYSVRAFEKILRSEEEVAVKKPKRAKIITPHNPHPLTNPKPRSPNTKNKANY